MPKKNFIPLLLLFAALFIVYGDSLAFLPKPVRDASLTSRNFAVGLWPNWLRPRDLNERRERELEELKRKPNPER